MRAVKILLGALLALLGVTLFLRWLSGRRSLPCPTWLSGLLENPWTDNFAGTEATLERIGLRPGQRVLEVGPGPGRLLIPAARRVQPGGEVVGLDIQPGMRSMLQARADRAGLTNLTAVLGDASRPNFPPGSFDVIYMVTVLGEIPDKEAALRHCYSALRPGGRLSITEILPDPHYQLTGRVRQLADAAGFCFEASYGPLHFRTLNFTKPDPIESQSHG